MEHTNTLRGQNAEFYYAKAGGIYSNHSALKGYMDFQKQFRISAVFLSSKA
jgi:hypothetical protein